MSSSDSIYSRSISFDFLEDIHPSELDALLLKEDDHHSSLPVMSFFSDLIWSFSTNVTWEETTEVKPIENQGLAELKKSSERVTHNALKAPNLFGAIGNERTVQKESREKYADLLNQFSSSQINQVRSGIYVLRSIPKSESGDALRCLGQHWKELSNLGKLSILNILAGCNTVRVYERGQMIFLSIAHDLTIHLSIEKPDQMSSFLEMLFMGSLEERDLSTLRIFFASVDLPVILPFSTALLKAMPKFPLLIQREIWESYLLGRSREIEQNESVEPFLKAYLHAASQFIARSFQSDHTLQSTAQQLYQGHTLTLKKQISEVLIQEGNLQLDDLDYLPALFHPGYIEYENLDSLGSDVQKTISSIEHPSDVSDKKLAKILKSGLIYVDRIAFDSKINSSVISLIKPGSRFFSILLSVIERLKLTETAISVLQGGNLSIKEEERLLGLYFHSSQLNSLLKIRRYQWSVVDVPQHRLKALVHSHLRHSATIPRFSQLPFLQRVIVCQAFVTVMGLLPYSIEELRKTLLETPFGNSQLRNLYASNPRGFKRLLIPYCTALLYNQKQDECANIIPHFVGVNKRLKLLNESGNEEIVVELEALKLHAIAMSGPSEDTAQLFEKTLSYIQESPQRIYATLFTNLLSIAHQIGKVQALQTVIQEKLVSQPLSFDALSWMAYHGRISADEMGVQFLHRKSLASPVPNNLPFVLLKLSLLLHLKRFDEANLQIQAYENLLPEYGFSYLIARAYMDPAYPDPNDKHLQRIDMFLHDAFLRTPQWIDISIASWLVHCRNPRLGISKEEFCSRLSFYDHSRISEVLHLLKAPYEKPFAFAERLEKYIQVDQIPIHEILSCFHAKGKILRNTSD